MPTTNELYNCADLNIDEKKPTVLFLNYAPTEKELHISTTDLLMKEYLSKQFNVLTFTTSGKPGTMPEVFP